MNTKLVGILNITPDSFSDGGRYNNATNAALQLELLLSEGAEVIDIGAVSTRPGSKMPSALEEIERYREVLPAIALILQHCKAIISIDSPNFATIEYLLEKIPVDWVNDQSGFSDHRMLRLLSDTQKKLVIMHHTCLPVDLNNIIAEDLDINQAVQEWLVRRANYLIYEGINPEQIIIDPGIGFGKSAKQSWEIIRGAASYKALGYPVLIGHSRKSFLNLITQAEFVNRDLETAVISYELAKQNIDFLRVHNIAANAIALKIGRKI